MIEVKAVVDALKGAQDLVEFASTEIKKTDDKNTQRDINQLIEALRAIYFSPDGVLQILKLIQQGEQPSKEQIEAIIPSFNDSEYLVERMTRHLHWDSRQGSELSLRARKVLNEIGYGKGGVRKKVQNVLNESLTFGKIVSKDDAGSLIAEISILNNAIEVAEEELIKKLK